MGVLIIDTPTAPIKTSPLGVDADGTVSLRSLFLGFGLIGLSGFGGVLPWARRYIVERYKWVAPEDFAALLGVCQIMPGPNVMTLSVSIGARFQGWRGAIVAPLGMMLAPMLILAALGYGYLYFGDLPAIHNMLRGISAVGAGLILATGLKMLHVYRRHLWQVALVGCAFASVALLRLPLITVVCILLPVGFYLASRKA